MLPPLFYDEFNIYTSIVDVEEYINSIISEGVSLSDDIYSMCLNYFGQDYKSLIDVCFEEDED